MEYYRTDDGQIQADFARRLGRVLKQYHNAILPEEKYESCLRVLHEKYHVFVGCLFIYLKLMGSVKRSIHNF